MSRPTLDPARRLGISDTRLSLSPAGLPSPFSYLTSATTQSEPRDARITVWALSISLAATLEIDKFSFSSSGYLDVSVPRVPHVQLCIHCTLTEVSSAGFPHSDISGSLDMCSSPKLFAAYHVFHRLLVPRHPPCALSSLTSCISAAGTAFIRRCIALHPWSLCLLDSFGYVSFDTPRMSCFLNIFKIQFIQYVIFKVR